MNSGDLLTSIRYFGVAPLAQGMWHRVLKKSGYFKKKFRACLWSQIRPGDYLDVLSQGQTWKSRLAETRFFFAPGLAGCREMLRQIVTDPQRAISGASDVMEGRFEFYSRGKFSFGRDVDWHRNPFKQKSWPKDKHWCDIGYFNRDLGDIKDAWELSRFSWAFTLVRAYALTGDPRCAERFWELCESWLENNHPNFGVNWVSGQECALRLMAWCFALFAFLNEPATTEDRVRKMLLAIAVHGERIEGFISHAIRQKTNHAVTEAAGLWTIGLLFPFIKQSASWKRTGKSVLEQEGLRQIYEDGSYVQHSMNYHRLMLQTYLWCFRLGQIHGEQFSPALSDRVLKATEFLYQLQDPSTGRVPNYGANDGARFLQLNDCDYLDYRPVIQAGWYQFKQQRLYEHGPWDEDLVWLLGRQAMQVPSADAPRKSSSFTVGGYYSLRSRNSWAMVRCHTYRDRVGHIDPLHLDLWADGINLLRDSGSYRYFAPDEPDMEHYFKSIWAHNTVIVDRTSPLRLVSRFIWLPWPKARVSRFDKSPTSVEWIGENDAYLREPWNVRHIRRISANPSSDSWQIRDELTGNQTHRYELRWHLPAGVRIVSSEPRRATLELPSDWRLQIAGSDNVTVELLTGQTNGGWESLYYSEKTPIVTLSAVVESPSTVTFETNVWKEGQK